MAATAARDASSAGGEPTAPPERLPRIFDGTCAVAPCAEVSGRGRGVGLPLVRRFLALHGGTVTAESDGPGRGSGFCVRLPIDADAPEGPGAT